MPYLKDADRRNAESESALGHGVESSGALNYIITKACLRFINRHGEQYAVFDAVIGALECAKLELYRRKIALYENQKIVENGDVYL